MKPTLRDIEEAVCLRFKISHYQICSPMRARRIARPRQIAMSLCRELTGASLSRIGDHFGGKDHSTVLFACRRIHQLQIEKPKVAQYVAECRALIVPQQREKMRELAAQPLTSSILEAAE